MPGIREGISPVSGCGVAGLQSVRGRRICGCTETVRQISTAAVTLSALSAFPLLQVRKIRACEQEPDGSSLSRNPFNVAVGFECDDHLVHGRRAHAKVSLHVGLGGRPAVDPAVVVNEREILSLSVREGFRRHEGSVPVFSMRLRMAEMLTCAVPVRACARHASYGLQNGSVQLLGIDAQPAGICLDDCDSADELPVSLPLLLKFSFQLIELTLKKVLL